MNAYFMLYVNERERIILAVCYRNKQIKVSFHVSVVLIQ